MTKPKEFIIGTGTLKKAGEKAKKFLRTLSIDKRGDVTVSWTFYGEEYEEERTVDRNSAKQM